MTTIERDAAATIESDARWDLGIASPGALDLTPAPDPMPEPGSLHVPLSPAARRLAAELVEDGIDLAGADGQRDLVLDELDYARRVPMFEGRLPVYGSVVMPPRGDIAHAEGIADVVPLDEMSLDVARTFADGRSAFLVRHADQPAELACFRRPVQYEAELVGLQQQTGALIVQRSPVLVQVRLFTHGFVASWNGRSWTGRSTALALLPSLLRAAPGCRPDVAQGLLDLTIHWLSPARVGASIVVHESDVDWSAMDVSTKLRAPSLSLTNREHYPALFAALQQRDLATLVAADGRVEYLGVGLRTSERAEQLVDPQHRGMRHRSAQRYTYDHPATTIAVVSENGPVTVFRHGEAIALEPTAR